MILDFLFQNRAAKKVEEAFNKLFAAQFAMVGDGSPVWQPDNPENYVKEGYQKSVDIYSIASLIAQKASMVDFELVEKRGKEEIVIESHPALNFIYNPNKQQSKEAFFEQLYGFYLLTGNTYTYFLSPNSGVNEGRPNEMFVLPAPYISVLSGNMSTPVSGYTLNGTSYWGNEKFTAEEVMHVKASQYLWGAGVEMYGQSPIQAAYKSVQASNASYTAHKKSLDNMGPPGMVYDKGQDVSAGLGLSADQQRQLEDKLRKLSGANRAGTLAVASGNLGYLNFGLSPIDLAILELQEMALVDACNIYHVDSILFNSTKATTYNNMPDARKRLYSDAALPLVSRVLGEFNRFVLPKFDKNKNLYFRAYTNNIPELQSDKKEMAAWLERAYYLTPNQKRVEMGYQPLPQPEMDEIYFPSTLVPLDLLGVNPVIEAQNAKSDYFALRD